MPVERRGQVIALKSGQPATGGTQCSMEGGSLHAVARASSGRTEHCTKMSAVPTAERCCSWLAATICADHAKL